MKHLISSILVFVLCLIIAISAVGEENGMVTVREWLDTKGKTTGLMVVCVTEIQNPMLATVEDETGSVNLFAVTIDGEMRSFFDADVQAGDVLLLQNPRYNEYEGTVEMADSVLLRKICSFRDAGPARTEATEYAFTASADSETEVCDLIFNGDVTIGGEGEAVRFRNCEFHGNLINTAPAKTVVWVMDDCEFVDSAHCVIQSGVREADMEYSIPKIATFVPVKVECEDLGGVIAAGLFDIEMNDAVFAAADAEYYQGDDGSIVPYEEDVEVNAHVVTHWWENGGEVIFTMAVK